MLNKKEMLWVISVTIILGFLISLMASLEKFLYISLSILIILLVNIFAKKIASFYLESEVEIRLWEIKKYWFRNQNTFKKPIPAGIIFPIILSVLTQGFITWMACLIFEVKPKIYRTAKRHGLYSFSEMTEFHIGLIAAAGIVCNLLMAVVAYLVGFPDMMDFARLSIFFAFFSMLPISNLDGNKIFFGNIVMWSFLAVVVLVSLGFVFLVI